MVHSAATCETWSQNDQKDVSLWNYNGAEALFPTIIPRQQGKTRKKMSFFIPKFNPCAEKISKLNRFDYGTPFRSGDYIRLTTQASLRTRPPEERVSNQDHVHQARRLLLCLRGASSLPLT